MVRPMDQNLLTHVEIELKILQIDLVIEITLVLFGLLKFADFELIELEFK